MSDARCQAASGVHRTHEETSRQSRVQGDGGEDGQRPGHRDEHRGRTFATFAELEAPLTAYIRFYNHRRLHSGIDYHTPEEYERVMA
ncbi:MAG: IS3 family transposase [candidate division NC10 bacterium]|nr:IS3 family transposase [candidate division NC10 bacterium]